MSSASGKPEARKALGRGIQALLVVAAPAVAPAAAEAHRPPDGGVLKSPSITFRRIPTSRGGHFIPIALNGTRGFRLLRAASSSRFWYGRSRAIDSRLIAGERRWRASAASRKTCATIPALSCGMPANEPAP